MATTQPDLITLHDHPASVQVCPSLGGAITRYWHDTDGQIRDWLRPADADAIGQRDPFGMACFPLTPFSSRIREGRFRWQGQTIQLPLNFLPERHTHHGHGWQRPWQIIDRSAEHLTIEYRHTPDAWPWAYRSRQTFSLTPHQLSASIALCNEGSTPMPAGIGLHPYFIRTPRVRVRAPIKALWRTDAEVMPIELIPPPPKRDLRQGVVMDAVALDNTFTGWSGEAVIEWPEWNARLTMSATPPLRYLVVFSPSGKPFFCVEPVSNITDAFNLADQGYPDTGTTTVAPGETLQATVVFKPGLI